MRRMSSCRTASGPCSVQSDSQRGSAHSWKIRRRGQRIGQAIEDQGRSSARSEASPAAAGPSAWAARSRSAAASAGLAPEVDTVSTQRARRPDRGNGEIPRLGIARRANPRTDPSGVRDNLAIDLGRPGRDHQACPLKLLGPGTAGRPPRFPARVARSRFPAAGSTPITRAPAATSAAALCRPTGPRPTTTAVRPAIFSSMG